MLGIHLMFGLINLVVCNGKFFPSVAIIHIKVPLNGYSCIDKDIWVYFKNLLSFIAEAAEVTLVFPGGAHPPEDTSI